MFLSNFLLLKNKGEKKRTVFLDCLSSVFCYWLKNPDSLPISLFLFFSCLSKD